MDACGLALVCQRSSWLRATTATGVRRPAVRVRREVQGFDVGRELLFERERHGLRNPRAAAHRKLGLASVTSLPATRSTTRRPATRSTRPPRTPLHGARAGAVRIHDEPRRRRLLGARSRITSVSDIGPRALFAAETAQHRPHRAGPAAREQTVQGELGGANSDPYRRAEVTARFRERVLDLVICLVAERPAAPRASGNRRPCAAEEISD